MEHCKPRHPQDEIEHDKKATLEFKWMLGVCYGNSIEKGVKPEDTTCDAHKGNAELTINPFDELSGVAADLFWYSENGSFGSTAELPLFSR